MRCTARTCSVRTVRLKCKAEQKAIQARHGRLQSKRQGGREKKFRNLQSVLSFTVKIAAAAVVARKEETP